ncbi:MAG: ExbD/TolR family protein [Myxococcota bacterium]
MRRRSESTEEASLSMTPLIDVVLLLLIFYVVTTAFAEREIELQLPDSQSSQVPKEKKKYVVELGADGRLALNGEIITVQGFDVAIGEAAKADEIRAVEIRADRKVYHGRVVEILGIVKKHGVDNVGIAVNQAEGYE